MLRTCLFLGFLSGCAAADTPEDAAQAFFSAAASGEESRVAHWIDPRCADAPVGQGAPARIMDTTVRIDDLDLVTTDIDGDRATVAYSFRGDYHQPRETHEVEVRGEDVTVTTPPNDIDMGSKSGNLSLIRLDGEWKVTCTFASLRTP